MAKEKIFYRCRECGEISRKWFGQCPACAAWNSLDEEKEPPSVGTRKNATIGYAGAAPELRRLDELTFEDTVRIGTGIAEFDRVLGGGIIPGSVILIGGDPGVGKSTILLQVCGLLCKTNPILYISGEESLAQIASRGKRLGIGEGPFFLLSETSIERICAAAREKLPAVMVVDSIQTMHVEEVASSPGSVSQVRESAAVLTQFAKATGTAVFLVGHVTKSGDLAGPRVLEHIIDVVCYIEGAHDNRYRLLRSVKNRYGAVNELGVFAMTEKGLREIANPSAIFLSRGSAPLPGSSVTVIWEGSRPMLIELQALVDTSYGEIPRRLSVGIDYNRLIMLLAILHRHASIPFHDKDVFVNVAGGMRINETSSDLALAVAILSSLHDKALPPDLIVFGEIGLAGEIRPVPNGQDRLREAAKHGFKRAVIPQANVARNQIDELKVIGVQNLREAIAAIIP